MPYTVNDLTTEEAGVYGPFPTLGEARDCVRNSGFVAYSIVDGEGIVIEYEPPYNSLMRSA